MSSLDTNLTPSQLYFDSSSTATQAYKPFLGPPQSYGQSSALEKRAASVWNLPDHPKAQQAVVIRDTVESIAFQDEKTTWPFTRILPLKRATSLVLKLRTYKALPAFMSVTPEQAVGQMLQQSVQESTVELIRFSIQQEYETGYLRMDTDGSYRASIHYQLSRSLQATLIGGSYQAILHAHDPQQIYLKRHAMGNSKDFEEFLKWDRMIFGTLQKDKNSLPKLYAMIKPVVRQYQGEIDSVMITEDVSTYVNTVPPENTDYCLRGPEGPANVQDRPGGRANTDLAGNPTFNRLLPPRLAGELDIYVVKSLNVEGVGTDESFTRFRAIGEFNVIQRPNTGFTTYQSKKMAIEVFNQDIDDFSVIGPEYCIENSPVFDSKGNLKDITIGLPESQMQDAGANFLIMDDANNGKKMIETFGDIDSRFFTANDLRQIGASIPGEFNVQDGSIASKISDLRDGFFTVEQLKSAVPQLVSHVERLASIFGSENHLFLRNEEDATDFLASVVVPGVHPVVKASATASAQSVDEGFMHYLLGAVEETQQHLKTQLTKIMNKQRLTSSQRINEMKKILRENLGSTTFANQASLESWLEAGQKELTQQRSVGSSIGSASSTLSTSKVVGYAFRDHDLPAGHAFKFEDVPFVPSTERSAFTSMQVHELIPLHSRIGTRTGESAGTRRAARAAASQTQSLLESSINLGDLGFSQSFLQGSARKVASSSDKISKQSLSRLGDKIGSLSEDSLFGNAISTLNLAAYFGVKFTRRNLLNLVNRNIELPCGFIFMRNEIVWETRIMSFIKAGEETGNTWFFDPNVMVGTSATRKTKFLNLTGYYRSHIKRPQNVLNIPDVLVIGYVGGGGVKAYKDSGAYNPNAMIDEKENRAAIILPLPRTERLDGPNPIQNPIDIRGRFSGDYYSEPSNEKLHYSTALHFRRLFWDSNVGKMPGRSLLPELWRDHVNTIMWRGRQGEWSDRDQDYTVVRVNTGHWGEKVYPGCGRARTAELEELRKGPYARGLHG